MVQKNLEITLTRQKMNELTKSLIDRLVLPMQTALNDARLTPQDLNKVILVGRFITYFSQFKKK